MFHLLLTLNIGKYLLHNPYTIFLVSIHGPLHPKSLWRVSEKAELIRLEEIPFVVMHYCNAPYKTYPFSGTQRYGLLWKPGSPIAMKTISVKKSELMRLCNSLSTIMQWCIVVIFHKENTALQVPFVMRAIPEWLIVLESRCSSTYLYTTNTNLH